jgi:hypothetical protein
VLAQNSVADGLYAAWEMTKAPSRITITDNKANKAPNGIRQKLYSAPRSGWFPVNISIGKSTKDTTPVPSSPSIQTSSIPSSLIVEEETRDSIVQQETIKTIQWKMSINCLTIRMCDKLQIDTWFSATKVKEYTTIVYETIADLNSAIRKEKTISDVLYSLTLSPQGSNRRWRWGSQTIQLYTKEIKNSNEFRNVLIHELAHSIDLGVVIGSGALIDDRFLLWNKPQFNRNDASLSFYEISWVNSSTRKGDAWYIDFVSGYGMTNPYEDFAESTTLFLLHNATFKAMSAQSPALAKKYTYLYELFGWFSFAKDIKNTKKVLDNTSRRPRDISKISYE